MKVGNHNYFYGLSYHPTSYKKSNQTILHTICLNITTLTFLNVMALNKSLWTFHLSVAPNLQFKSLGDPFLFSAHITTFTFLYLIKQIKGLITVQSVGWPESARAECFSWRSIQTSHHRHFFSLDVAPARPRVCPSDVAGDSHWQLS